jgi:hypothetical protein
MEVIDPRLPQSHFHHSLIRRVDVGLSYFQLELASGACHSFLRATTLKGEFCI